MLTEFCWLEASPTDDIPVKIPIIKTINPATIRIAPNALASKLILSQPTGLCAIEVFIFLPLNYRE
jgi:hypothetical protein